MTDRRPLVTVVVAAHDAARHLGSALDSLGVQSLDDLEVVVVDDGSTDATAAVAEERVRRDPRFRLLRLGRNRGQAAALNAGMEEARGRHLALLDADDEATPGRLAAQVDALERDPGLVLVGGAVVTFCDRHSVEGAVWRYATDDAAIRARTLFKSEVISGAITFDRERIRGAGIRFDETLRLGVDWALSVAAMRVGGVGNLPSVVMRYRIHPRQMTVDLLDDLGSDSTRIRREVLAWAGIHPGADELRTHLALSPCNYWPFGSHPYFQARGESIREDARRWLGRLVASAGRGGRVPVDALAAYAEEILRQVEEALERPLPGDGSPLPCLVSAPLPCISGEPCR